MRRIIDFQPILSLILFLGSGVILFSVIAFFDYCSGEWTAFAKSFRAWQRPEGNRHLVPLFRLGRRPEPSAYYTDSAYNGVASAIVSSEGLYLNMHLYFRAFHPPLFIPWSAFSALEIRGRFFSTRRTAIIKTSDGRDLFFSTTSLFLGEQIQEKLEARGIFPTLA